MCLNFHRPGHFVADQIDAKGKIRKTYPHDRIMTPWERLKTIPNDPACLIPGIDPQSLEDEARAIGDNEAANQVQQAGKRLKTSGRIFPYLVVSHRKHASG